LLDLSDLGICQIPVGTHPPQATVHPDRGILEGYQRQDSDSTFPLPLP